MINLRKHLARAPSSFDIVLCTNPFQRLARAVKGMYHGVAVIADRNVSRIYGRRLTGALTKNAVPHLLVTFPPGDRHKSRETKEKIEDTLVRRGTGRDWAVVALGGGVTGDLAGFIAATYMRGIDWFNIPTSLLAMVDASIGGKTSVNTPSGKNLIGAFHQPRTIFISSGVLETLPAPRWLDGAAEIIKHAAACDGKYFRLLEDSMPLRHGMKRSSLEKIIRRSVEIKSGIVVKDEKEKGLRSILNFGHTVGHAIEAVSAYSVSHGTAVAMGMIAEARISSLLRLLHPAQCEKIEKMVRSAGFRFPSCLPAAGRILRAMQVDKKKKSGNVRLVLLEAIGRAAVRGGQVTHEVPTEIIREALGGQKSGAGG